jgi:GNAT superfamily N-acetyltransferase
MTLTTRPAVVDDYAAFAQLFPELGVHDPTPTVEQFATRMLPRVVIVRKNARVIGYAFWQAYGATAHVVHVVVDPAARGLGAGRALLLAVHSRALEEDCSRWYLNVKRDNAPAIRLYERCGLQREHESFALRIGWTQLDGLAGDGEQAALFGVAPSDDQAIGARFALDVARITQLRARGLVLLGLREASAIAGFAAFDPAFPGVYPFRVARPSLARPLLDALRPYADLARFDFVRLTVEADPVLNEALCEVGAELAFALYQMGGPIGGQMGSREAVRPAAQPAKPTGTAR